MRRILIVVVAVLVSGPSTLAAEASLRGSRAGMIQQNSIAQQHGLTFHRTAAEIRRSVDQGELVELVGNDDFEVAGFVSHPYLIPAGVLFVERLAAQYREACDERLVVTSATRPSARQPRNAHALSVHPAGMAVDLRVSQSASCRQWLESALLGMERQGLINGIREFRPPHYHVAIFPGAYGAYAAARMAEEAAERQARAAEMAALIHVAPVSAFRALDAAPEPTIVMPRMDPTVPVWSLAIPGARAVVLAAHAVWRQITT